MYLGMNYVLIDHLLVIKFKKKNVFVKYHNAR